MTQALYAHMNKKKNPTKKIKKIKNLKEFKTWVSMTLAVILFSLF
jgi:NADH:ubiquinone oxidoreductase subunit 2 (subunit N)